MTYYIYHLPNFVHTNGAIGKIGCTITDPFKRAKVQGYRLQDLEVLEEHTDIYIASDRELELQEEYGYPVDKIPYYVTVRNTITTERILKGVETKRRNGTLRNGSIASRGIAKPALRKLTFIQAQEIRSKFVPYVYTKPMLAKEYNVSTTCIANVLANLCYLEPLDSEA
jgi:hypothetical protein